jgi:hypothetical protein
LIKNLKKNLKKLLEQNMMINKNKVIKEDSQHYQFTAITANLMKKEE